MNNRENGLDEALDALFRDLDITPGFNVNVLARLHTGRQLDFIEQANRSRQLERARYSLALREAETLRRAKLRLLTLDGIGIACLLIIITVAAGRNFEFRVDEIISAYYPYVAVLLGILIAAVPLIGMAAERDQPTADVP